MNHIIKHDDEIENVKVGDIIEIKKGLFIKIMKVKRHFNEFLAGNKRTKLKFDAIIVDIK